MTKGIMEVVGQSVYDLKFIGKSDISYNPALGTGQIQIRDIHYVEIQQRTASEFIQILDEKFIRSQGKNIWIEMARKNEWIKESE